MEVPREAVDLILRFEGLSQPSDWPGGLSGITLGHGYDLGHCSFNDFESDWGDYISEDQIARFRRAIGKTGSAARWMAEEFEGIAVSRHAARAVFEESSLPKTVFQCERAFPGIDVLPPLAQGALLSLVYNRGASMVGERRREMKAIRDIVRDAAIRRECRPSDLQAIANEIRHMKRLWTGKGLDGLLRRREAEAKMVEACITGRRENDQNR